MLSVLSQADLTIWSHLILYLKKPTERRNERSCTGGRKCRQKVGVTELVWAERGGGGWGQRSDSVRPAADQDYALLSLQHRLQQGQGQSDKACQQTSVAISVFTVCCCCCTDLWSPSGCITLLKWRIDQGKKRVDFPLMFEEVWSVKKTKRLFLICECSNE